MQSTETLSVEGMWLSVLANYFYVKSKYVKLVKNNPQYVMCQKYNLKLELRCVKIFEFFLRLLVPGGLWNNDLHLDLFWSELWS